MPTLFPGTVFVNPNVQFFDNDGRVLAGGFLQAYLAGTTTPQDTYNDSELDPMTHANTNPIELDSSGRASVPIFLAPVGYKFVLSDANSVEIWTRDDVEGWNVFPNLWGNILTEGGSNVTTGYTVLDTDRLVTVDSSGGATTINLLAAGDATQPLTVKNLGTNTVTVTPDGTDRIDGLTSYVIAAAASPLFPTIMLASDGVSSWWILASHS
jgi:hypothetical protein